MADAAFNFAALDPALDDGFAFLRDVPEGVDGIRIGIADSWFRESCENGVGEIVRAAIVARAGAIVKEAPLPEAHDVYALYLEGGLSAVELRTFLDRELPELAIACAAERVLGISRDIPGTPPMCAGQHDG